jgi:hypothetical protein
MSENENKDKEIADIQSKLQQAAGNGTTISNITTVAPGQYQVLVHLDPSNPSARLFAQPQEKLKALVRERQIDPDSPLAIYASKKENKALRQRFRNAGMKDIMSAIESGRDVAQTIEQVQQFNRNFESATLDQRFRDVLRNSNLDIRRGSGDSFEAKELYERSEEEYKKTGIYGTYLDLLSNFAATGFHNEHKDPNIKQYFDSWVHDTNFLATISTIFYNLFKYSVVYVLPATGPYEEHPDGISSIPGQEPTGGTERARVVSAFSTFFSENGQKLDRTRLNEVLDVMYEQSAAQESGTPVAYTMLDPKEIETESSVFGGETLTVKSSGLASIREALDRASEGKLSKEEKDRLKLLPSKIRAAALSDEDYTDIDGYIQSIYLRKNDFETHALPKGTRVFDSFDYKEELKKADYATLDGVFNYILKVTVGDKDNPVTDAATLDSLAEAFNTAQKAMTVVWNHTLNIEKITNKEVGDILGIKKYEPVNSDITAALGMTRALIDGGNVSAAAGVLSAKALQSEISAARKIVESWIYQQYKRIAADAGFTSYPVVRWKQTVISTDSDAVTRASWMQLADRQISSRTTAQLAVDLDPASETEKLKKEKELFEKEGIGILGSPFQQSPSGDQGRPPGQPSEDKAPSTDQDTTRKSTPPSPSQQPQTRQEASASPVTAEDIKGLLSSLSDQEKASILEELTPDKYKDAYTLQRELLSRSLIHELDKLEDSSE